MHYTVSSFDEAVQFFCFFCAECIIYKLNPMVLFPFFLIRLFQLYKHYMFDLGLVPQSFLHLGILGLNNCWDGLLINKLLRWYVNPPTPPFFSIQLIYIKWERQHFGTETNGLRLNFVISTKKFIILVIVRAYKTIPVVAV